MTRSTRALKLALAAACAALTLAFACACTKDTPATPDTPEPEATTKMVTDAYGREVTVPTTVARIATVGSGARYVVYAGAQDLLVAVTDMETAPAMNRPYTIAYSSLFTTLPSTSNGNHLNATEVDAEALLALQPDVIISSRSAAECDALQAQLGIPVIGISYQNQLFTQNVYNSILVVGEVCGTVEHAQSVVDALKAWESDINARVAKADKSAGKTVYAASLNFKGSKSWTGTAAHYPIFDILGLANVADASGNDSNFDTTLEQIAQWDPDYIFVNMGNVNLLDEDYNNHTALFQSLTAIKDGNVYSQPFFNYNGTNLELAICDVYFVGSVMYPDAFGDLDLAATYAEILETLLGVPYYDTMVEQGMKFGQVGKWSK